MASWIDVCSLIMTVLSFVGIILGVLYVARTISSCVQSTKASLENKGITLSRDGVTLKTKGRFDREAYVDATQRGLVKALGAATVGPESHKHAFLEYSHANAVDNTRLGDALSKHTTSGAAMRRSHSGEKEGRR